MKLGARWVGDDAVEVARSGAREVEGTGEYLSKTQNKDKTYNLFRYKDVDLEPDKNKNHDPRGQHIHLERVKIVKGNIETVSNTHVYFED